MMFCAHATSTSTIDSWIDASSFFLNNNHQSQRARVAAPFALAIEVRAEEYNNKDKTDAATCAKCKK